jgi:1-phosphatidylinositol phosphodiesterase
VEASDSQGSPRAGTNPARARVMCMWTSIVVIALLAVFAGAPAARASSDNCSATQDGQYGAYCNAPQLPSGTQDESNWMSALAGSTLLSELTLPGTHDTGTFTLSAAGDQAWQAQSMSLPTQLAAGIRAIDIRVANSGCGGDGNSGPCAQPLGIYHGTGVTGQFTGGYLNSAGPGEQYDVMQDLQTFLDGSPGVPGHPGETVVMNIQDAGTNATHNFAEQVNDVMTHFEPGLVYNGAEGSDPPLSAIRGKVVVITQGSEYSNPGPPSGITWPEDNNPGQSAPYVQDYSSCPTVSDKSDAIYDELQYAGFGNGPDQQPGASNGPDDLNINFTSANCDAGAVYPWRIAAQQCGGKGIIAGGNSGCNLVAMDTLDLLDNRFGPKRYGIIYSDFPGAGLIEAEIAQNSSLPQSVRCPRALGSSPLGGIFATEKLDHPCGSAHGARYVHYFRLAQGGYLIATPSPKLLAALGPNLRSKLRGKVALVLAWSRNYRVDGLSIGSTTRKLADATHLRVGRNEWYLIRSGARTAVFKARAGRVRWLGLASRGLTTRVTDARRLLATFG